jgi:hypothetical protein
MKSCPVCGLIQDESCLFCPEDGSALTEADASGLQAKIAEAVTEETSSAVVLYCPACAAEYPLTFSVCPVHAVPLTKHRIPTFVAPPAKPVHTEKKIIAQPPVDADIENVSQEVETHTLIAQASSTEPEPEQIDDSRDDLRLSNKTDESASEGRGLRRAAVAVSVCLALLGLLGLYSLYSNVTRRPNSPAAKTASQANTTPMTVYTPQAALDYKEEKPEPEKQESDSSSEDKRIDNERPRNAVGLPPNEQSRRDDPVEQKPAPVMRQQPQSPVTTQVSAPRSPSATELVLPRGTYGQVDARLLNVRSRKTPNGFRYDLTFNMQEQMGRTTQWERLAIVTRSSSGISHSQAMPFYHRLGAAGTLTFTVSVEMQGRAQPDWTGRIICTSIGTDQTGKAYRASFGANVAPK